MAKVNYNVGDTIQYRHSGGGIRTVLVEDKDPDIKNGRPGFAGLCTSEDMPFGGGCWGYDDQVIRVVEKCKSTGN